MQKIYHVLVDFEGPFSSTSVHATFMCIELALSYIEDFEKQGISARLDYSYIQDYENFNRESQS